MDAMRIYAIVLTLNEQRHISECLASLAWADGRIVFDSFSTDNTVYLAREAGAQVTQNAFVNYAQQRNVALSLAQTQLAGEPGWVFFVDADERCTPELADEIRRVTATDVAQARPVWSVPRHNFLFGRLTKGAGWYPDFQARLFAVGKVWFDPAREVHEVAMFDGDPGRLTHPLTHFNYDSVAQFHIKQRKYSDYDAGILFKQGLRPRPHNFVLQPLREFRRRFLTLRGYQDGLHGLHLSALMAYYEFEKYRKLAARWRVPG
jgi:(heptosyl)LPS beta-1,4-glucosyltransferase